MCRIQSSRCILKFETVRVIRRLKPAHFGGRIDELLKQPDDPVIVQSSVLSRA